MVIKCALVDSFSTNIIEASVSLFGTRVKNIFSVEEESRKTFTVEIFERLYNLNKLNKIFLRTTYLSVLYF